MTNIEFNKDISIAPYELEEEWFQQPALVFFYGTNLAEAVENLDKAKLREQLLKDELEGVRAKLDLDIRANPEKFGIAKITENAIANAIILEKKVTQKKEEITEAAQERITAQSAVNTASSAFEAIKQKKKALENAVQLLLANYFSGPKEPKDLPKGERWIRSSAVQEGERKTKEALKRKKK